MGKTQTQDNPPLLQGGGGISTSFSQNSKQILVASDFWSDSNGVSRRQHHPLYRERGQYGGSSTSCVATYKYPSPCTFSSKVLAHVRFFCCLSYGHVKVLRNGFLRQRLGIAASLFSAPLLLLLLHSLVSFLFAYVVSF